MDAFMYAHDRCHRSISFVRRCNHFGKFSSVAAADITYIPLEIGSFRTVLFVDVCFYWQVVQYPIDDRKYAAIRLS